MSQKDFIADMVIKAVVISVSGAIQNTTNILASSMRPGTSLNYQPGMELHGTMSGFGNPSGFLAPSFYDQAFTNKLLNDEEFMKKMEELVADRLSMFRLSMQTSQESNKEK